ncbi:hypothetical protein AB0E62_11745 [Streptomyces sp. NPDC038707]|uniref:hypothetical protein n=1 Tax=Streptomyces sp. NPDC038707 TaxID=3154329 RepID=UPI0034116D97
MSSPVCTAIEAATTRQVRGRPVAAGLTTDTETHQHLADVEAGTADPHTAPALMISPWGCKA